MASPMKRAQPGRFPPLRPADQKQTLVNFLEFNRQAIMVKVDGVSEHDAHRRVVASGTSLVGLLTHLTDVERFWFETVFAGQSPPAERGSERTTPTMTVETAVADYRSAIAAANTIVERATSLDVTAAVDYRSAPLTLGCILTHMISETARHAGHADILRELIDGTTGL
jgi:uncharacterized damage-inducible protein DinB